MKSRPTGPRILNVQPDEAEKWLAGRTPDDPKKVAEMVEQMTAFQGAWKDYEPVVLRVTVVDGLHRLAAIVETGKPVKLQIEWKNET